MRVISMRSRNPVVVALMIVVALGALALAFMVGVILLSTLVIAGTLIGAGLVIRNKIARGLRPSLERQDVRASLDPSMEVRPDRELLPRAESKNDEP